MGYTKNFLRVSFKSVVGKTEHFFQKIVGLRTILREKCPYWEYLSVFSPNAGKYGPE